MTQQKNGLVHLYIGDGKGKTSASIGLAVRARGAGMRVLFAQFLKGRNSSEISALASLEIDVMRTPCVKKFIPQMNDQELADCRCEQQVVLETALQALQSGEYGLVVLDESVAACGLGLIDEACLVEAIKERCPTVEVVLTGRDPSPALLELADYISEIQCIRHPYSKGIDARIGIEF